MTVAMYFLYANATMRATKQLEEIIRKRSFVTDRAQKRAIKDANENI